MNAKLLSCLACLTAGVPAAAQSFTNGNFNSTLSGWSIVNTANGVGAPGSVALIDIDGPGPLGTNSAARFQAGQAVFQTGVQRGVEMTQTFTLTGGTPYSVHFDWSAQKFSGANAADGGVFSLIVNGDVIAQGLAGATGTTLPRYGHVSGTFTPSVTGPASVGIRITRAFTPATDLYQFADNVTLVAPPSSTFLGALPLGPTTVTGTLGVQQVRWFSFTVPEVAAPAYLDIDTEGSALLASNDTVIGLYTASGDLVALDDDDGTGFLSQLTFGNTEPRAGAGGDGFPYDGRDGSLPAGTYFLAIAGFPATFGAGWNVSSGSTNNGDFRLNLALGADVITGACCMPLGGCAIRQGAFCSATGGAYQGDGSDCASADCLDVLFESGRGCQVNINGSQTVTGFSSGSLPSLSFPQRWTAQAFTLAQPSHLEALTVAGFVPTGSEFTTMNYIIWSRTGSNRPLPGDQIATGSIPVPSPILDPRVPHSLFKLFVIPIDVNLPAGSYYLTVYASDPVTPGADANFAWAANTQPDPAHPGAPNTPIFISDAQGTFMWRSAAMPDPGFERHTSNISGAPNPTYGPISQDPNYVYNTSFTILGEVMPATCYPNCDTSTSQPLLTPNDFACFLNKFAAGDPYANCDLSTGTPILTPNDFLCFINAYAAGCS